MLLLTATLLLSGCGRWVRPKSLGAPLPNPVVVPAMEDQFVWLQVVNTVEDYFRIESEQPVQNRDGVILEGRLETSYRVGAGVFEPWRQDSTPGFERLQSTLQSIRRRALVSVRPRNEGYEIEIIVLKELEDVDRSLGTSAVAAVQRHDGTVVRSETDDPLTQQTLGWIPQGRDLSLEQVILQDIVGRLTGPERKRLLHH